MYIHMYLYMYIYRLTHSMSEVSGFTCTCTGSLTMNKKFQYREAAESGIENFEFMVSEQVSSLYHVWSFYHTKQFCSNKAMITHETRVR